MREPRACTIVLRVNICKSMKMPRVYSTSCTYGHMVLRDPFMRNAPAPLRQELRLWSRDRRGKLVLHVTTPTAAPSPLLAEFENSLKYSRVTSF